MNKNKAGIREVKKTFEDLIVWTCTATFHVLHVFQKMMNILQLLILAVCVRDKRSPGVFRPWVHECKT